jgi:hypothetical protein
MGLAQEMTFNSSFNILMDRFVQPGPGMLVREVGNGTWNSRANPGNGHLSPTF